MKINILCFEIDLKEGIQKPIIRLSPTRATIDFENMYMRLELVNI